jgi:RecJ-like exonuclease
VARIGGGVKILTYDAWVSINRDLVNEIKGLASKDKCCARCKGTGEEECPECGYPHECPRCDGSGYEGENHIGDPDRYLRKMYDLGVELELQKIAKWGVVVGERELTEEIPCLETVNVQPA